MALLFLAAFAKLEPLRLGLALARAIGSSLLCAVRVADTCGEGSELDAAYGDELAAAVRRHAPDLPLRAGDAGAAGRLPQLPLRRLLRRAQARGRSGARTAASRRPRSCTSIDCRSGSRARPGGGLLGARPATSTSSTGSTTRRVPPCAASPSRGAAATTTTTGRASRCASARRRCRHPRLLPPRLQPRRRRGQLGLRCRHRPAERRRRGGRRADARADGARRAASLRLRRQPRRQGPRRAAPLPALTPASRLRLIPLESLAAGDRHRASRSRRRG